jgi:hypothetical protein
MPERLFARATPISSPIFANYYRVELFTPRGAVIVATQLPTALDVGNFVIAEAALQKVLTLRESFLPGGVIAYFCQDRTAPESPSVSAPSRAPRVLIAESLGTIVVGWWAQRPDDKEEGSTLPEVIALLAARGKIKGEIVGELRESIVNGRGWKSALTSRNRIEYTEVLAEVSAAGKCEMCNGTGKYVGLRNIEDPCSGCRGAGVAS